MDWNAQVDGYCERLDPGFWAEPVNALTNAAFLIAALIMAARLRGARLPLANALVAILAVIGIGSFLFHTFATRWAGVADVLPILVYILVYIYTANHAYWGLRALPALGLTALFFPYAAVMVPVFTWAGVGGGSAGYAPVPLLILIYAALLRQRLPQVARGLAIGAGILILSLTFRTIDMPVCSGFPLGTHFLWHVLNGLMLGWMIEVYRRHATQPEIRA
jgi:hypothetical protein